ncbi:MAG TPA: hypothetical protein VF601_08510 [Beijerinckiaceae bacterium]|jgi:hypothetical protein
MADPKQSGGTSPQASDIVESVTSVASKIADTAQEKARGLAATAEDKVRALAEDKKRQMAEQAESVAKMVDGVAAGVEAALPPAGAYVRGVASEIHRVTEALRDRSVDDLVDEGRRFAQQRPGAVLAGALVLGFGLARFLKASADRRHDARGRQAPARPGASGASRPGRAEYPSDVASEGPGAARPSTQGSGAQGPGAQGPGAHGAASLAADRSSPHGR